MIKTVGEKTAANYEYPLYMRTFAHSSITAAPLRILPLEMLANAPP
jgi:hypothetical protein